MPSTTWTPVSSVETWDHKLPADTWALETENWNDKSTGWGRSLDRLWSTTFETWDLVVSSWG